jgi:hypothetical protein
MSRATTNSRELAVADTSPGLFDLAGDGGMVYWRRDAILLPVSNAAHGASQDLAGPGLRQAVHHHRLLQRADRTHLLPYHLHQFCH